jgi:hypothetical protein
MGVKVDQSFLQGLDARLKLALGNIMEEIFVFLGELGGKEVQVPGPAIRTERSRSKGSSLRLSSRIGRQ